MRIRSPRSVTATVDAPLERSAECPTGAAEAGRPNAAAAVLRPVERPKPRDAERPFGPDEIFFSTTDRKGIIRSSNRVFARVSGHPRARLIGAPHNVIRHPDMPRVVFKLLWDEIGAGRPIAAYVKNLAADGAHYWVMATVTPCSGGYLSVRIKPGTPYFEAARRIYADLLALEREVEAGDPRRRGEAMEAAAGRLGEHLARAGFSDYEGFMRTALLAEVKARPPQAADSRNRRGHVDPGQRALGDILEAAERLDAFLGMLVGRLDDYAALNSTLGEKSAVVLDLADDVRLFSLNALIASHRVQANGASLGAVASLMQTRSEQSDPIFRALTEDVLASTELLGRLFFPVAATRLQAEMMTQFVRELQAAEDDERPTTDDLGALAAWTASATPSASSIAASARSRVTSARCAAPSASCASWS
jgi:PAS domain S-box-containing protein